jgi:hypothetical protein
MVSYTKRTRKAAFVNKKQAAATDRSMRIRTEMRCGDGLPPFARPLNIPLFPLPVVKQSDRNISHCLHDEFSARFAEWATDGML